MDEDVVDIDEELTTGDFYIEALMEIEENAAKYSNLEAKDPFDRSEDDAPSNEVPKTPDLVLPPGTISGIDDVDVDSLVGIIEQVGEEVAYSQRFPVEPVSWIRWIKNARPYLIPYAHRLIQNQNSSSSIFKKEDFENLNVLENVDDVLLNIDFIRSLNFETSSCFFDELKIDWLLLHSLEAEFLAAHFSMQHRSDSASLPIACKLLGEDCEENTRRLTSVVHCFRGGKISSLALLFGFVGICLEGAHWKERLNCETEIPTHLTRLVQRLAEVLEEAGVSFMLFKDHLPIDWICRIVTPTTADPIAAL